MLFIAYRYPENPAGIVSTPQNKFKEAQIQETSKYQEHDSGLDEDEVLSKSSDSGMHSKKKKKKRRMDISDHQDKNREKFDYSSALMRSFSIKVEEMDNTAAKVEQEENSFFSSSSVNSNQHSRSSPKKRKKKGKDK